MRIAHVVPAGEQPWSGVMTVIVELAIALAGRGHDVELWCLHRWQGEEYEPAVGRLEAAGVTVVDALAESGLATSGFPSSRRPNSGGAGAPWWRARAAVRRLEQQRRPDVVHLHGSFNPSNTLAERGLQGTTVVSPHGGLAPECRRRRPVRKAAYLRAFEVPMLRRAAAVVALTDIEAADLAAFGLRRIVVVANGVTSAGEPARRRRPTSERIELLYVGRLDVFHKGLDRLLDGLAAAPDTRLTLVGPDHKGGRGWVEARARALGIADRVTCAGALAGRPLDEAFAGVDAFALVSRWEGMPMALLEALARGVPAVVSPEVERVVPVAATGAGWVASDVGAGLRALGGVDAATWAARSTAAGLLASRYRWDEAAARYDELYATSVRERSAS